MSIRPPTTPRRMPHGQRGFTLTEVLVTLAMTGLLTASMFSVYLSMQRTTYNQEDIVDTQQSLRVAMDAIARDIRMAGFVIPKDLAAIDDASDADTLAINTTSSSYAFARIDADLSVPGGTAATTPIAFTVAQRGMMDPFLAQMVSNPGTIRVRLIRPADGSQPLDVDLTLPKITTESNREAARTARTMTLTGLATAFEVPYRSGDMIALVTDGGPDPATITWGLAGGTLQRTADGGAPATIADNVASVSFAYIDKDGTEFTAFPMALATLKSIAAVRVTLIAAATRQMDQVDRQRSMTGVIRIKNQWVNNEEL